MTEQNKTLAALQELAAEIDATAKRNKQTLDAIGLLAGLALGILLDHGLVTRQALIERIETAATDRPSLEQEMLTLAQTALAPRRH